MMGNGSKYPDAVVKTGLGSSDPGLERGPAGSQQVSSLRPITFPPSKTEPEPDPPWKPRPLDPPTGSTWSVPGQLGLGAAVVLGSASAIASTMERIDRIDDGLIYTPRSTPQVITDPLAPPPEPERTTTKDKEDE